jgi:hypothetical protein
MATAATRRENNDVPRTAKIDLTPTGLLMEGHFTQNPWPGRFECNGDLTPVTGLAQVGTASRA